MKLRLVIGALALLPPLFSSLAAAQPSFAGKTVSLIVGYKPGGGYDTTARMLARHLPNHLPGKPTVIVQNMPGGNSIIAANHLYNVAKPDGLSFGTFNRNLPIAQLTGVQGVKFDMQRSAWIGSAADAGNIPATPHNPPSKNFHARRHTKQP